MQGRAWRISKCLARCGEITAKRPTSGANIYMNLHKLGIMIIIPKQTNITLDIKIYGRVLSREQMACLRELGVDTSDASMAYYNISRDNQPDKWILGIANIKVASVMLSNGITEMEPTYTIGDLIDKLPKAIEGNCLVINYIYSEIIYKDILHYDFEGVGLLATLYAVLCWVAENHIELIK